MRCVMKKKRASIETYHKAMLETKTKIKFKCSWLRLAIAVTEANCGHAKPFCHVVRPWHLGTFDFISVSQLSFENKL